MSSVSPLPPQRGLSAFYPIDRVLSPALAESVRIATVCDDRKAFHFLLGVLRRTHAARFDVDDRGLVKTLIEHDAVHCAEEYISMVCLRGQWKALVEQLRKILKKPGTHWQEHAAVVHTLLFGVATARVPEYTVLREERTKALIDLLYPKHRTLADERLLLNPEGLVNPFRGVSYLRYFFETAWAQFNAPFFLQRQNLLFTAVATKIDGKVHTWETAADEAYRIQHARPDFDHDRIFLYHPNHATFGAYAKTNCRQVAEHIEKTCLREHLGPDLARLTLTFLSDFAVKLTKKQKKARAKERRKIAKQKEKEHQERIKAVQEWLAEEATERTAKRARVEEDNVDVMN